MSDILGSLTKSDFENPNSGVFKEILKLEDNDEILKWCTYLKTMAENVGYFERLDIKLMPFYYARTNSGCFNLPLEWKKENIKSINFPLNCLPEILRIFAEEIAISTETDVEMSATMLLTVVSNCLCGVYRMQGKIDHTEPLNLYSLTIAESAERKSPVMKPIKAPFIEFEKELNNTRKTQIFEYQNLKEIYEKQLEVMKRANNIDINSIQEKYRELEQLKEVSQKRMLVDDTTIEALKALLEKHKSMLLISEEAGFFQTVAGRYCNGIANVDLLLKAYNGENIIMDRRSGKTLYLENPHLSICMAGQPYILQNFFSNETFRSSGLTARFIYCFHKSKMGSRHYNTQSIQPDVKEAYKRLIYFMLNHKVKSVESENLESNLVFTDEAYNTFVEYVDNVIEPSLLGELIDCRDWGGKFAGLILRLCGILHCVKQFSKGVVPETSTKVDIITLGQAVDITEKIIQRAFPHYEAVLATHTDRNHLHCHIVINAYSFEYGKKIHLNNNEYGKLKDLANQIDSEYGYSTIDFRKKGNLRVTSQELQIELNGGTSWKEEIREVVDLALIKTSSIKEFEIFLNDYGITLSRNTANTISYQHPKKKKSIRGEKLGLKYTKGEILNELSKQARTISNRAIREDANATKQQYITLQQIIDGDYNKFSKTRRDIEYNQQKDSQSRVDSQQNRKSDKGYSR